MNHVKGVLLDFDGTIIDSLPVWLDVISSKLTNHGSFYDFHKMKEMPGAGNFITSFAQILKYFR